MSNEGKDVIAVKPEWSHIIDVRKLEEEPLDVQVKATEQECRDVANRLQVVSIESAEISAKIIRETGTHVFCVKGVIKATLTQNCVVSLEPVSESVEDVFEAWFADDKDVVSLEKVRRERQNQFVESEMPISDEHDDPEPLMDGHIDIGELATQQLALAINPYPRASDAVFEGSSEEDVERKETSSGARNPFAALKSWKAKREEM